ncbi:MAG: T9SS type A sorting domain-containing protein [Bacteroidia bacterium]|jgi:predicted dienelactone hydrolase
MKQSLFYLFFCFSISAIAQPYAVGHRSLSLLDAARNRTVTAEVYYPATSAGDNVAFASGNFPVFTLAHGFVIPGNTYQNFADELVPDGYVIVLPTTESSFLPNHDAFGKDIAFLNTAFRSGGVPFFSQFNGRSAIGGHSMGGGASALAATQTIADAYIGFAPAITNPSPVPQGGQIEIPALVFSGSADGVTPPETNHQPIYDSFASDCKTFVSITSGVHCFFIPSSLCDIGESGVPGGMTRELQQQITFDYLRPFLNTFLLDDSASWQQFQQSTIADNRITFEQTCSLDFTGNESILSAKTRVFPQPCSDVLQLEFSESVMVLSLNIYDMQGRKLSHTPAFLQNENRISVDIKQLPAGMYVLEAETTGGNIRERILKVHP